MNPKLKEINGLIALCDQMLSITQERGFISTNHELYQTYKRLVKPFCINNDIYDDQYAPYVVLNEFYRSNTKLNRSMVCQIRGTLIAIKHFLFENSYEKIFISHREKDAEQVDAFVDLLHAIGIPRPTTEAPESVIFCTSHPEGYIKNGERNLDTIRDMINTDEHVFYILWYTDRYFESQACLNEAGAIWAMKKKYQEILMPNFDEKKINGLLDKQQIWFKANDKERLNDFAVDIQKMFSLPKLTTNSWEMARDKFIQFMEAKAKEQASCSQ